MALFVDPRGPYPGLVAECYDEARDARTYAGPWPVVAHPPCGPWGRLRHLYRGGEGPRELAIVAIDQVRRWGGALEHPRYSQLWKFAGLPLPGEPTDVHGGRTIELSQCDWGHPARKMTWVYVVGGTIGPYPASREPTHWISGGRGRAGKKRHTTPVPPGIKVCSAQQRRRTPPAFAVWLLDMAAQVNRSRLAKPLAEAGFVNEINDCVPLSHLSGTGGSAANQGGSGARTPLNPADDGSGRSATLAAPGDGGCS